ncbi:hypothetical protein GCM10029978_065180 [Actinoallomurus acanthiterrae]
MAADMADLKTHAERLRELHGGEMLVLPNVWDAAGATIVADAGFPAVATSSAAIAAMLGHPDGEGAPWQEMFAAAGRVARAVPVPVTVDAEAGYGMRPRELVDRLLDIGAVGCNLEDTDHRAGGLAEAGAHAHWLAGVRSAADEAGVPIVINARVDTFLPAAGYPSRTGSRRRYDGAGSTGTPAPTASTRSACATSATSPPSSPRYPARSTATQVNIWTWPRSGNWAWRECPTARASTARPWPT